MYKIHIVILFFLVFFAEVSLAKMSPGYWYDGSGNVLRDGHGDCVITGDWTRENAIEDCHPELFAAKPDMKPINRVERKADNKPVNTVKEQVKEKPVISEAAMETTEPASEIEAPLVEAKPSTALAAESKPVTETKPSNNEVTKAKAASKPAEKTVLLFDLDSVFLDGKYISRLMELVDWFSMHTNLTLYVQGHTCNIGSESYNETLGLQRAKKVAEVLNGLGLKRSRMVVDSSGEKKPVASNISEEGRKQNRRVELIYR